MTLNFANIAKVATTAHKASAKDKDAKDALNELAIKLVAADCTSADFDSGMKGGKQVMPRGKHYDATRAAMQDAADASEKKLLLQNTPNRIKDPKTGKMVDSKRKLVVKKLDERVRRLRIAVEKAEQVPLTPVDAKAIATKKAVYTLHCTLMKAAAGETDAAMVAHEAIAGIAAFGKVQAAVEALNTLMKNPKEPGKKIKPSAAMLKRAADAAGE